MLRMQLITTLRSEDTQLLDLCWCKLWTREWVFYLLKSSLDKRDDGKQKHLNTH